MSYVNPLSLESRTRPGQLQGRGIVALAPLLMVVWFAYWVGMVSQACCLPLLPVSHHSSHAGVHDDHHDGGLAALEHDAPMDHESCSELKSADLVPASTVALMDSTSKPVLMALYSLVVPLPIFSTSSSHTLSPQSHPPPNRYLRTRRLLI